jgi:hypothetical protein
VLKALMPGKNSIPPKRIFQEHQIFTGTKELIIIIKSESQFSADSVIRPFFPAVRCVAGVVKKFTFLLTRRTRLRRGIRFKRISANGAFPAGHFLFS